jgi:hypothetical protein
MLSYAPVPVLASTAQSMPAHNDIAVFTIIVIMTVSSSDLHGCMFVQAQCVCACACTVGR